MVRLLWGGVGGGGGRRRVVRGRRCARVRNLTKCCSWNGSDGIYVQWWPSHVGDFCRESIPRQQWFSEAFLVLEETKFIFQLPQHAWACVKAHVAAPLCLLLECAAVLDASHDGEGGFWKNEKSIIGLDYNRVRLNSRSRMTNILSSR